MVAKKKVLGLRSVSKAVLNGVLNAVMAALLIAFVPTGGSRAASPMVEDVPKQPLAVHVNRLTEALNFVGRPISEADRARIDEALGKPDAEAVRAIQDVLDTYALVAVDIDPLRNITVTPISASTQSLTKNGWSTFLVKVINRAAVTEAMDVDSPQAAMPYDFSRMQVERSVYEDQFTDAMLEKHFHIGTTWGTWGGGYPYKEPPQPEDVSPGNNLWPAHGDLSFVPAEDRWAAASLYREPPLQSTLSGLKLEYVVLQLYSRDEGSRSMTLSFNIGTLRSSGTGSVPYVPGNPGMRGETDLTFDVRPPVPVTVNIIDEDGSSTAARFTVRDDLGNVYPHRAKRYAPDLFFQNHVYRYDGETIELPPGEFTFEVSRGPHYLKERRTVAVTAGTQPTERFELKRWLNPQSRGWTSNDKHVHTAGCLHYNDPTYGMTPDDMLRYSVGEDLDIADVMIWGPNWYYQKNKYFKGKHPDPVSTAKNVVTHNLEISQFPSSAGGHTSGHGLREIDYPGTKKMRDWPSYTLPILKWIQSQGGLSSYTHAGFGLDVQSTELPNYITPPMDSIGANEFIMTVAHDATDWIGVGNTNFVSELNIWYHTLNAGFRALIGGETDWPCINGDAVGRGRSYVKTGTGPVSYAKSLEVINIGNHYVSDGRSHLMELKIDGKAPSRIKGEEVKLSGPGTVEVTAQVAAHLPEEPETVEILGEAYPMETQAVTYKPMPKPQRVRIADLPITGVSWRNIPWWHLERARIGESREVLLEVIVNAEAVASTKIVADGSLNNVSFDVPIEMSSWVALRILGASHTNPIWVLVDGKPVRGSRKSIEWDIRALQQAFEVKRAGWRPEDYAEAKAAYDFAYQVYAKRLAETTAP
ncbi:MAG: CehA/McbA family metallohydrolase [Gammaproteobacteria bacterium]